MNYAIMLGWPKEATVGRSASSSSIPAPSWLALDRRPAPASTGAVEGQLTVDGSL